MNATNNFHDAKSHLECALTDFIKAAQADDRDIKDELDEALYNSCKATGHKTILTEIVG